MVVKNEYAKFEGIKEQQRSIYLPAQFSCECKLYQNNIQQYRRSSVSTDALVQSYIQDNISEHLITSKDGAKTLITNTRNGSLSDITETLYVDSGILPDNAAALSNCGKVGWLNPKLSAVTANQLRKLCKCVNASWKGKFRFRAEQRSKDGEITVPGLRSPQIGALHAALAHWTITDDPATIVMPTGTGKTETMLALLIHQRPKCLLIVVPTDALRSQVSEKFLSLGVLGNAGVIKAGTKNPIVGILKHRLKTVQQVEEYFSCCNVIITTMQIASGCSEEIQKKMAELSSHLFIDEAHHIKAPTWETFRQFFTGKTILQFTATPYRSDGKQIEGKIIFDYPLRKAQEEGYFKPIDFLPVRDYQQDHADISIAQAAIMQLNKDIGDNKYDHLLMARTSTIERAKHVYEIYKSYGKKYSPLLIHSGLTAAEKTQAVQTLKDRKSRIIVCVGMLGEGFDLPELKIAALHDIHKSLAITVQFTGRFTRIKDGRIGNATVIANIADADVENSLRDLYAEDSDWNVLLRRLSEGATGREVKRTEFLDTFIDEPTQIPLQNIFPKMSTVAYRAYCSSWNPDKLVKELESNKWLYGKPAISYKHKILLFVTRERIPIGWGDIRSICDIVSDLYLLHWDEKQGLLFINSTNNNSQHEDLAKTLVGDNTILIRGEQVFRCLQGINRLILTNLGLNHSLSRAVRFTMFVGADIRRGLSEARLRHKYKSNVFGRGFAQGEKASLGCSHRGRIWSYKIAYDISEWMEWCHQIGTKLIDDTISTRDILDQVIIPDSIKDRPSMVPLTIEWSESVLQRSEESIFLEIKGEKVPLYDVGLEILDPSDKGALKFRVFSENKSVEYEIHFSRNKVAYTSANSSVVSIFIGNRKRSLPDWFQDEPPIIRFADGSSLIYNLLYKIPDGTLHPFDKDKIQVWDWDGIDLKVESQTSKKLTNSIQFKTIQYLAQQSLDLQYDIIFDDDATNEAADIVAIKVTDDQFIVHLFHCKFAINGVPSERIDNLYTVCGQAQRSVHWKGDVKLLLRHLRNRELSYKKRTGKSRFERGDLSLLSAMEYQVRFVLPEFNIYSMQPGLSKTQATTSQLELLSVTELYLKETYEIGFGVIGSS